MTKHDRDELKASYLDGTDESQAMVRLFAYVDELETKLADLSQENLFEGNVTKKFASPDHRARIHHRFKMMKTWPGISQHIRWRSLWKHLGPKEHAEANRRHIARWDPEFCREVTEILEAMHEYAHDDNLDRRMAALLRTLDEETKGANNT